MFHYFQAHSHDGTSLYIMLCSSEVEPPSLTTGHYYNTTDYIPSAVPFICVPRAHLHPFCQAPIPISSPLAATCQFEFTPLCSSSDVFNFLNSSL